MEIFFQWEAPEFQPYTLNQSWYGGFNVVLMLIIAFALYTNSPIMAITFILIGLVSYLQLNKEPALLHCSLTSQGVVVEKNLYEWDNIQSFWIDADDTDSTLILKTHADLRDTVHIPLAGLESESMRLFLRKHILEEEYEPSLVDTIEKTMHI